MERGRGLDTPPVKRNVDFCFFARQFLGGEGARILQQVVFPGEGRDGVSHNNDIIGNWYIETYIKDEVVMLLMPPSTSI